MASGSWEPRCCVLQAAKLLPLSLSARGHPASAPTLPPGTLLCVSWCFYKNTNVWVRGDPGDLILTRCICKDLISKWADIDDTETGGSELQSVLLEDSIRASLNRSSLGRFSRRRDFQWLPSWCPQGSSTKTVQTGCSVLTGCSGCQQGLEQTVGWVGSHLV